MKKQLALFTLLACVAGAHAADPATPKPASAATTVKPATAGSTASQPAVDENGLVTNVVGSQEAPTVLNVVPWKDKEVKLEKKNPTTSILNQVLQPLDRDVLKREVQYFRSLQEQKSP